MVDGHYPRDVEKEMAAKDNIIERATFGLKSANASLLCGRGGGGGGEEEENFQKAPHSSNARTAAASRNLPLCVLGQ